MIQRKRLLSIGYYKKAPSFTGSDGNKNYKVEKYILKHPIEGSEETNDETVFRATVWPGPLCLDKTDDDLKQYKTASFDEDGLMELVDWMNSTDISTHKE